MGFEYYLSLLSVAKHQLPKGTIKLPTSYKAIVAAFHHNIPQKMEIGVPNRMQSLGQKSPEGAGKQLAD